MRERPKRKKKEERPYGSRGKQPGKRKGKSLRKQRKEGKVSPETVQKEKIVRKKRKPRSPKKRK